VRSRAMEVRGSDWSSRLGLGKLVGGDYELVGIGLTLTLFCN